MLFADSSRGIYIPQYFAQSHDPQTWTGINPNDLEILIAGPENEFYWEAWDTTLHHAETVDGATLHQDGDLWVINREEAITTINEYCAAQLEYEETHKDAGDNYSHMPAEGWCLESDRRLARELAKFGIEAPPNAADIALDLFKMRRDPKDGIILDSYALQEVAIDLSPLNIDPLTMDIVRNSCEAHITADNWAFVTTDAVWFAVVDPEEFRQCLQ
jgi:hypothetical protein